MLFSLFLFPASFLRHDHRRLTTLGAVHAAAIIGQDGERVVVTLAATRNLVLVYPGAPDRVAVVTAVQRQKRELVLAAADADARFLVLAEFTLEADKTSHDKPRLELLTKRKN